MQSIEITVCNHNIIGSLAAHAVRGTLEIALWGMGGGLARSCRVAGYLEWSRTEVQWLVVVAKGALGRIYGL